MSSGLVGKLVSQFGAGKWEENQGSGSGGILHKVTDSVTGPFRRRDRLLPIPVVQYTRRGCHDSKTVRQLLCSVTVIRRTYLSSNPV